MFLGRVVDEWNAGGLRGPLCRHGDLLEHTSCVPREVAEALASSPPLVAHRTGFPMSIAGVIPSNTI